MRFLSGQGPVTGSKDTWHIDSHFRDTLTPVLCGEQLSWWGGKGNLSLEGAMSLRGLLWTKRSPWAPHLHWTTCHTRKVTWGKARVLWPLCVPRLLTKTLKLREQVQLRALRLGSSELNSVGSSTPRHPQKDMVVSQGQGREFSACLADAHTLRRMAWAHHHCQGQKPRRDINIALLVKAFSRNDHRNNGHFRYYNLPPLETFRENSCLHPKPSESPRSLYPRPQLKQSRNEHGPTEGKKRLKKQIYQHLQHPPVWVSASLQEPPALNLFLGSR